MQKQLIIDLSRKSKKYLVRYFLLSYDYQVKATQQYPS